MVDFIIIPRLVLKYHLDNTYTLYTYDNLTHPDQVHPDDSPNHPVGYYDYPLFVTIHDDHLADQIMMSVLTILVTVLTSLVSFLTILVNYPDYPGDFTDSSTDISEHPGD